MATIDHSSYTLAEWRLICWLNLRQSKTFWVLTAALWVAMLGLLVLGPVHLYHWAWLRGFLWGVAMLTGLFLWQMMVSYPQRRLQAVKSAVPFAAWGDAAGLHVCSSLTQEVVPWSLFSHHTRHPLLVMLHLGDAPHVFLAREFAAEEWAELCRLVAQHVPARRALPAPLPAPSPPAGAPAATPGMVNWQRFEVADWRHVMKLTGAGRLDPGCLFLTFIPLAGSLILLLAGYHEHVAWFTGWLVGSAGLLTAIMWGLRQRYAAAQWCAQQTAPFARYDTLVRTDERGLHLHSALGYRQHPWASFTSFAQDDAHLVLHEGAALRAFRRRDFSDEQWQDMLRLTTEHVPKMDAKGKVGERPGAVAKAAVQVPVVRSPPLATLPPHSLSTRDVLAAVWLHLCERRWFGAGSLFLLGCGILILVIVGSEPYPNGLAVGGVIVFWAFTAFANFAAWIEPWQQGQALRQDAFAVSGATLHADDTGLQLVAGRSIRDYRWAQLRKFRAHPRLLLLYTGPESYLLIARRHFTEQAWAELLHLTANHLPESGVNEAEWRAHGHE